MRAIKLILIQRDAISEFSTVEEAKEYAKSCIDDYIYDDSWDDAVQQITISKLTHICIKANVIIRPDNLEDNELDESGHFWPEHVTHLCDYKISKL